MKDLRMNQLDVFKQEQSEITDIKSSDELLDEELENVEGGGSCICWSGNTNYAEDMEQFEPNNIS